MFFRRIKSMFHRAAPYISAFGILQCPSGVIISNNSERNREHWNEFALIKPRAVHTHERFQTLTRIQANNYTNGRLYQSTIASDYVWGVNYPYFRSASDPEPNLNRFSQDFHKMSDYAKSFSNLVVGNIMPTDYILYYVPKKLWFVFVGNGHEKIDKVNDVIPIISDGLEYWIDYNLGHVIQTFGRCNAGETRLIAMRSWVREAGNIKKILQWIASDRRVIVNDWNHMECLGDFCVALPERAWNLAGETPTPFHAYATDRFCGILATDYNPNAPHVQLVDDVRGGICDRNDNKLKQLGQKLAQMMIRCEKPDKKMLVLINDGNTWKTGYMDWISSVIGASRFGPADRGHVCGSMQTANKGENPQEIYAQICREMTGVYLDEITSDSKDKMPTQEKWKMFINQGNKKMKGINGKVEILRPKYAAIGMANPPFQFGSQLNKSARRRLLLLYSQFEAVEKPTSEYHIQMISNLMDKLCTREAREYQMKLLIEDAHVLLNSSNRMPYEAPEVIQFTDKWLKKCDAMDTSNESKSDDDFKDNDMTPITRFIKKTKKCIDIYNDEDFASCKTKLLFDICNHDQAEYEIKSAYNVFIGKRTKSLQDMKARDSDASCKGRFYRRIRPEAELENGGPRNTVKVPQKMIEKYLKRKMVQSPYGSNQRRRLNSVNNNNQNINSNNVNNNYTLPIQVKPNASAIFNSLQLAFGTAIMPIWERWSGNRENMNDENENEKHWKFLSLLAANPNLNMYNAIMRVHFNMKNNNNSTNGNSNATNNNNSTNGNSNATNNNNSTN
eukprot:4639_1